VKYSVLFEPRPATWGLRGDPYLWQALLERYGADDFPATAAELVKLLEAAYQEFTGQAIEVDQPVYVEQFAHGGMSSGYVSPTFWQQTGMPLLVERFERLRASDHQKSR
jgi:hypothetical protein